MSTSTNLGLILTPASEVEKNFMTWRTELSGDTDSSLTKIDAAIGGIQGSLDGKTPTSHAAFEATYGKGSSTDFGHVKLSDATDSTSDASSGFAATPKAVKAAYDLADGRQRDLTGLGSSGQFVGFGADGAVTAIDNPLYIITCDASFTDSDFGTRIFEVTNFSVTPEDVSNAYASGRYPVIVASFTSFEMMIPFSSYNENEIIFSTSYNGESFYVIGINSTYGSWSGGYLGIDMAPSQSSMNMVTSGGVYDYVNSAIQTAIGDALEGSY